MLSHLSIQLIVTKDSLIMIGPLSSKTGLFYSECNRHIINKTCSKLKEQQVWYEIEVKLNE